MSPDVRIQTESKKRKSASQADTRKKSIIDSGLELFFKKSNKSVKDACVSSQSMANHPLSNEYKYPTETTYSTSDGDNGSQRNADEPSRWKLFDTIKIHTDKRRSVDSNGKASQILTK